MEIGVSVGASYSRANGMRPPPSTTMAMSLRMAGGAAFSSATRAGVNAGGVRDSLAAGKITYKDVLKVQPFGNTLSTVDLSGSEVMDYLNAAAKMSVGSGAFAQFAGVSLEISSGKVSNVRINKAPLDPGKTYRMVINNFQATGGDGTAGPLGILP